MPSRADTFDRANTSASLGTPSDGGSAWVQYTAGGGSSWGISSNRAYDVYDAGTKTWAVLDAALADVEVLCTQAVNSGGLVWGLSARVTDFDNGFAIAADNFNGWRLLKYNAGVLSVLGTHPGTPADGDVVKLSVSGSSLTVTINGTLRITATDSFNATATAHGLFAVNAYTGATRWDDFSITVSGGGSPAFLAAGPRLIQQAVKRASYF